LNLLRLDLLLTLCGVVCCAGVAFSCRPQLHWGRLLTNAAAKALFGSRSKPMADKGSKAF
jgi:hypothetical protein